MSFFLAEISRAQGGSGVAGDGLYVECDPSRCGFRGRGLDKHIQEDAASEAEGAGASGLLKICSELENNFLEATLGAASEVGAEGRSEDKIAPGEAEFAIKRWSESGLTVGAKGE